MENISDQENPPVSVNGSDAQSAACMTAHRARMIDGTDVVECLTDDPICHWGFTFGGRIFCNHPSNKLISEGTLFNDCPATFSLP